jgi:thaumarchaeosortase
VKLDINRKQITPIILIIIAIVLPLSLLFILEPDSFSMTWTGRTYYLFFLWLIFMEAILDWEKITQMKLSVKSRRTVFLAIFSMLPTVFVIAVHLLGGRSVLEAGSDWLGVPFAPIPRQPQTYGTWVLSLEYLVFTALFTIVVWLSYRRKGLKTFGISLFILGAIGTIYMIDTLYPYGYFTPFQAFVPFTASRAADVLNWMGYRTTLTGTREPYLAVYDASGRPLVGYGVGWPCAGVQGLLIYTFIMLIFFKKTAIPLTQKIAYFIIGSIITYTVNIFRIVGIYLTYINNLSQGRQAAQAAATLFHNYYGGLLSMAWIISYPLLIIGSRMLWQKIREHYFQTGAIQNSLLSSRDSPSTR